MSERKRMTQDVWHIYVNYGHGWEHELTEATWADARAQLATYRANCSWPVKACKRRERIQGEPNGL